MPSQLDFPLRVAANGTLYATKGRQQLKCFLPDKVNDGSTFAGHFAQNPVNACNGDIASTINRFRWLLLVMFFFLDHP
jgi:hypothetical protein